MEPQVISLFNVYWEVLAYTDNDEIYCKARFKDAQKAAEYCFYTADCYDVS